MKYYVVGLGNPGSEYASTRHNAGRLAVEYLAEQMEASSWRMDKKTRTQRASGVSEDGSEFECVLPEVYMNCSGEVVASLVAQGCALEQLIILHDDIDLPFGTMRISFDRGAGGHNGIRSITQSLNTSAFLRVRIGVLPMKEGVPIKPASKQGVERFLLRPMHHDDVAQFQKMLPFVYTAVRLIASDGVAVAMERCNGTVFVSE
jgi:PTH1 family peptidyl-tRNA hydrolase